MTIQFLKYVLAVAEIGSITEAARFKMPSMPPSISLVFQPAMGLSQNGKHLRQVLFMPMNAKQMDI